MLDRFDYAEPACPLCGGKDFYNPQQDAPDGRIPVGRIIEKVDALFDRNQSREAGRLLEYWRDEAVALKDKSGELAIESELVGYYRKQNDRERGLASIARALSLTETLEQSEMASGATVYLNCATAYKAFGMAEAALPLYVRAEAVYKSVLEPTDARFGGLYNNMALTLAALGDIDGAEQAYFAAVAVMEAIPGGEAETAITYINLAHLYEAAERYAEIGPCMAQAKQLLESDRLSHDGHYAFVLENCAPSFGYFGDTATAEAMQKEAAAIYARA